MLFVLTVIYYILLNELYKLQLNYNFRYLIVFLIGCFYSLILVNFDDFIEVIDMIYLKKNLQVIFIFYFVFKFILNKLNFYEFIFGLVEFLVSIINYVYLYSYFSVILYI